MTGRFRHTSGEVYDLKLESESKPIGVTASHPFWSVDREDWVSAIDLEISETLKTLEGTTIVESFEKRPGCEPVYNIEVEGDHVYRVGESGVLVHNQSAPCNPCDPPGGSVTYKETQIVTGPNGSVGSRAIGGFAIVTPTSASQSSTLGTPPWWNHLPSAPPTSQNTFVRGHLIAGTFGGAGGDTFKNLVPLYRRANNPGMEQCELRIKHLAEECGYCVTVEVTADYSQPVQGIPANVQQMVPDKITIEWVADRGPNTSVVENRTVTVLNSPNASSPCASSVNCQ